MKVKELAESLNKLVEMGEGDVPVYLIDSKR